MVGRTPANNDKPVIAASDAQQPERLVNVSQRRAITGGVMLAMFLAALDGTVVSTAMPTVIAQLGGLEIYSWVFSAFMLASTVTGPVWGRMSDLYGRKRLYLAAITLFLLGSVLAGLSDSMAMLISTRALQGLGAGGLFAISVTLIGEIYSMEQRARMQGVFSAIWGFASIMGPLVGGFLTDTISWRWAFYVNVPFGVASMLVLMWALKRRVRDSDNEPKVQVDYVGALTLTVSVSLLLLGLLQGDERGWADPLVLGMMGIAACLIVFFVWWERQAPEPIVPPQLFKNRFFSAAAVSGLFVGMAMFGTISFLPLFVQGVLGSSATEAGYTLTPFMLGWVVSAAIGGRVLLRIGYRVTVFGGMAFLLTGFILFTTFNIETPRYFLLGSVAIGGLGMGLIITSLLISVQSSVPAQQLGIATSASIFSRSIGGTLGVAVLGTVMTIGLQASISELPKDAFTVEQLHQLNELAKQPDALVTRTTDGAIDPLVLSAVRGALAEGLHNVFVVGLMFAIAATLAAFLMPKGKAQDHVFREPSS